MKRQNYDMSLYGSLRRTGYGLTDTTWPARVRRTSEVTSGLDRRKPKGWIPPTGYHYQFRDYRFPEGTSFYYLASTNWLNYRGVVGGPDGGRFNAYNHFDETAHEPDVLSHHGENSNAALIAARNKLKGMNVNLGAAWGERKATSRQVGDACKSIADAFRNVRRGNFAGAARDLGVRARRKYPRGSNITQNWLAMQYGWLPMLSDIHGSCVALEKRDRHDWRVTAKATKRSNVTWSVKRIPTLTSNFDGFTGVAKGEFGSFCRIDALPDNPLSGSLASIGVTNPLLVAWELVPYSFVVDWFLPVGNWLESLDAMLGFTQAYTSQSDFTRVNWRDTGESAEFSNGRYVRNNWVGTKDWVILDRSATAGVPIARFPRLKDPWSLGHMANGLSLLAQVFGKK